MDTFSSVMWSGLELLKPKAFIQIMQLSCLTWWRGVTTAGRIYKSVWIPALALWGIACIASMYALAFNGLTLGQEYTNFFNTLIKQMYLTSSSFTALMNIGFILLIITSLIVAFRFVLIFPFIILQSLRPSVERKDSEYFNIQFKNYYAWWLVFSLVFGFFIKATTLLGLVSYAFFDSKGSFNDLMKSIVRALKIFVCFLPIIMVISLLSLLIVGMPLLLAPLLIGYNFPVVAVALGGIWILWLTVFEWWHYAFLSVIYTRAMNMHREFLAQ